MSRSRRRRNAGDGRSIAIIGLDELKDQYKKLAKEIGQTLAREIGSDVLEQIRVAMSNEIMSFDYKSDLPFARRKKRGYRRWPLANLRASPGHARRSWAKSLRVVPLGSLQAARFEGVRILATGKSGSFYGRLIERGHKITNYWRSPAPPNKKVRGRYLVKRVFKQMEAESMQRTYRAYFNAMLALNGKQVA